MLQCVAVCCSVLQCYVTCIISSCAQFLIHAPYIFFVNCMLQYVAVYCSVSHFAAVCYGGLRCVAVCCSALQCVALCYSVLQCVATCCSVLLPWVATFVVSSSMQRLPHAPSLPLFISKVRLFNDRLFPLFQLPRLQCCHTIHEHLCT